MACRQACPYNTLNGCIVKELDGTCPLTNVNAGAKMPLTNADRIRAMTDEELANFFGRYGFCNGIIPMSYCGTQKECSLACVVNWLRQPVKED